MPVSLSPSSFRPACSDKSLSTSNPECKGSVVEPSGTFCKSNPLSSATLPQRTHRHSSEGAYARFDVAQIRQSEGGTCAGK